MKQIRGDMFSPAFEEYRKVIPTNIGWRKDGKNVMGRGLALYGTKRYPDLSFWYGQFCQQHGIATPVVAYPNSPLILFPTKPLADVPYLSWTEPSSLELIKISTRQLAEFDGKIVLPLVGCGNGHLSPEDVIPILEEHLKDDRFVLVSL